MVVNGSLSKTAVNGGAGAHTQLSGLIVAALTVVTLLILTGLFEQLPEATLAAVVIAAVIELVDVARAASTLYRDTTRGAQPRRAHARTSSPPSPRCSACSCSTRCPGCSSASRCRCCSCSTAPRGPYVATLGRVPGSEQYADIHRNPDNRPPDGVAVLRVEGGIYFANADAIRAHVLGAAADGVHAIVLDAETIPFIDVTAARMLDTLAGDLRRRGVELLVARDVGQVRDLLGHEAADRRCARLPERPAAVEAADARSTV